MASLIVREEEVREIVGNCGGHKWIAERITELLRRKIAAYPVGVSGTTGGDHCEVDGHRCA